MSNDHSYKLHFQILSQGDPLSTIVKLLLSKTHLEPLYLKLGPGLKVFFFFLDLKTKNGSLSHTCSPTCTCALPISEFSCLKNTFFFSFLLPIQGYGGQIIPKKTNLYKGDMPLEIYPKEVEVFL